MICAQEAEVFKTGKTESLRLPIFGYNVIFTDMEDETGKFGELVKTRQLYRFWDFSIPESIDKDVWNGYARRYINGYVAKFNSADNYLSDKYQNVDDSEIELGKIKAFDFIACEDRQLITEKYKGLSALMTLKGELENALQNIGLTHLTILRPPLLKRENSDRLGEVASEKVMSFFNQFGLLLSAKPMPTDVLAKAMIQSVADNKTGVLNKREIWGWGAIDEIYCLSNQN